jgi:TonB family protein
MRVLVADHDAKLLAKTARALASDFAVDVATSKLSCLAMLDVSEFHVIVACERLEDGSGLELLSQAGKRWPEVLRVLAVEADRLPLLAGRLKPFRLFETVPYPLNPDKLRNVLMLAQAAEDAHVDTMNVQHIVLEDEIRGMEAQPAGAAQAARAPVARSASAPASRARAPSAPPPSAPPRARTPAPAAATSGASTRTALSAALQAHVAVHGAGSPAPAIPGAMSRRLGERRAGSERRGTISVSEEAADSFADIDALAEASQIAQAMRPKLEGSSNLFGNKRTTLFIVAGVGAVAVAAAAMMLTGRDSPGTAAAPVATLSSVQPVAADPSSEAQVAGTESPPAEMTFETAASGSAAPMLGRSEPPEVVAFVADIETALTVDNFARARSLLDMLREVAPDHPRLAFFDALISRGEELERLTAEKSGTNRVQGAGARAATRSANRAGDPPATAAPATRSEREVTAQRQAALRSLAPAAAPPARAPASVPKPQALAPAPVPAAPTTFSGRTLEDSSRSGPSQSGSAVPESDGVRRPSVVLPVVKDARVLRQIDPEYPRDAMREGVEGSIELRFTVKADGKVADIEVVTANPPQTFDRAAISALRRWRYEPRREDGVAVDSRTRVRLEFKLTDRPR